MLLAPPRKVITPEGLNSLHTGMQIKTGLKRWSKLHLVRTMASIAAFGLAAFSLAASDKAEPQIVAY